MDFCARFQESIAGSELNIRLHPLADGGEGSLAVLRTHLDCTLRSHQVHGPLGLPREIHSGSFIGGIFIESAQAIGLPDGHGTGQPGEASSRGLGEWIRAESEAPKLIIGLGGSATVDGGIGMLSALGLDILDKAGHPVEDGARGLAAAWEIRGECINLPTVEVWCDVRTPLSACVSRYGPQKGLPHSQIVPVSQAMARWGDILVKYARGLGRDSIHAEVEGGGAAGGIALALHAVLGAELCSGAQAFVDLTSLDRFLENMDWVLCVEGQMDMSSFEGKLMEHVIYRARRAGLRVAAMVGRSVASPPPPRGPDLVIEIGRLPSRDVALARAFDEFVESIRW